MREIKFRAFYNGEFIYWENGDKSNWFWDIVRENGLDVEQYAGLKDKNGKEGCENDKCLFPDGKIRTLIYGDGCFGFMGALGNIVHCDQFTFKELEIIGNINEKESK